MLKRFTLFVVVLGATLSVNAQKPLIKSDVKLSNLTVSDMKMTMDIMGQEMEIQIANNVSADVTVKPETGKGYSIHSTTKKVVLKGNAMGQEMNFDSDKPEDMNGELGTAFKDKIGKTEVTTVGPDGKILTLPAPATEQSGGIGDMSNMLSQMTQGQPHPFFLNAAAAKQKKVGDSWVDSSGSVETMKIVSQNKVTAVSGTEVTIASTAQFAKKGTMEQQGMEMQVDFSGPVTSTSVYDLTTGLLKSSSSTYELKGQMEAGGQEIPMGVKGTATIELKPVK